MVKLKAFLLIVPFLLVVGARDRFQRDIQSCPLDLSKLDDLINLVSKDLVYGEKHFDKTTHLVHPRLQVIHDDLTEIRNDVPEEFLTKFETKSRVSPLFTCPDAEKITPCVCLIDDEPILDCSAASSFSEIKSVLGSADIPYVDFGRFRYNPESTDTGDIPSGLLGSLTFEGIYIVGSTAESLADDAFAGSEETLTRLYMDSNVLLSSIQFSWVENFVELGVISIGGSVIKTVPKFGAAPSLTQISITYSQVEFIESNAFSDLPSLLILDLGANELEVVTKDMMMISSLFLGIYLDSNKIVEMTSFEGAQPVLLELTHNFLTDFEEEIYKPILDRIVDCPITSYVSVTDNPIDCSLMEWVTSDPDYSQHIYSSCRLR